LKKVLESKPAEETPLKRELVLGNEVILVAFGSLNDNLQQEFLILVLLRVYNATHQYCKFPDLSKIPRYIKLGEVWSAMFAIYTGLDDRHNWMLTWLRLACFFDDYIFEGNSTMMGWINAPPDATHLQLNVAALKSWKRTDVNISFITNELIKLDIAKHYIAAVANVRALDQISRELHININYKD
jgi:hypothetical protein